VRVYDLQPSGVRLESTTVNGHWRVTEDGLCPFGHRKDHRPDLPHVKIMVSALDPLGMPVATDVVPGQRAGDPVSVPALMRVRDSLVRRGLLYVGDGKMGALDTRAFIQMGGDDSWWPLSETPLPRPSWLRLEWEGQVTGSVDLEAVAAAVRQLGWRVYVTTQPPAQLSLQEAVLAYRNEYLVERTIGRLKGRPWSLTSMYLEREDHATGLIRLLSIGLRVPTRLECGMRCRLAMTKTKLVGLYSGNPTRATVHPTAERLLEAFQGLTLTIIREGRRRQRHLTPLTRVHQHILVLLDFPVAIDARLWLDSHKPP
jgi:transposase